MRFLIKVLFWCFIFILSSRVGLSQELATVSIVITDINGDSIALGRVLITDINGKKVREIEIEKKEFIIKQVVGLYDFEIQSPGFKTYRISHAIKSGPNTVYITLEVADVAVNVEVQQSEREKRLDEIVGGYLTEKEIASLPENGEDIKEELKKRYGDNILIRIDGDFEGSQVPSRAEISSIKVIRNAFDAEFHEVGRIIVDIRTNIIASGFHGFGNFTLNSSRLNARNPFALRREPTQRNNLFFGLSGPLMKSTSFSLSTFQISAVNTQNFVGNPPDASAVEPQQIENTLAFTSFGIKHNLSKNHLLNFKYQNTKLEFKNFGVGSFDLPERGANLRNVQHKFSVMESRTFKNKYLNDLTFEFSNGLERISPKSSELTIIVLNSFNKGGAGINNRNARKKFKLVDSLSFDTKEHSLKIGAEIEYENFNSISEGNLSGTFTFLNLENFNNRRPSQFSQTLGKTEYKLSQVKSSSFLQDYFKPSNNFQLSLGMRYEWQNGVRDNNNFSPRFGYVWSPETTGKIIVRGGIGVFYDWLDTQPLSAVLSNNGRQGKKIVIRNPGFPDPFSAGTVSPTLPSISRVQADLTSPYIFVSQTGFNYKVDKSLTLEGVYTFRRGLHQFRSRNINAPLDGIRPDPDFGIVQLLESSGVSTEHSFEMRTNAYYKGVNIYGNYQFAKQTSDFSDALSFPSDNYNIRHDRGPSNLNQPHKLNLSFNFDLWKIIKISPSFKLESGVPYTITTGMDDNGDTMFNDRPTGIGNNGERGAWLQQADLRFQWKLPMKYLGLKGKNERRSINVNTNVRNLFNTANLTNYIGIQTSPFFQRATSARPARSIDVGMSFSF